MPSMQALPEAAKHPGPLTGRAKGGITELMGRKTAALSEAAPNPIMMLRPAERVDMISHQIMAGNMRREVDKDRVGEVEITHKEAGEGCPAEGSPPHTALLVNNYRGQ